MYIEDDNYIISVCKLVQLVQCNNMEFQLSESYEYIGSEW